MRKVGISVLLIASLIPALLYSDAGNAGNAFCPPFCSPKPRSTPPEPDGGRGDQYRHPDRHEPIYPKFTMRACNESGIRRVEIAYAYLEGGLWISRGWEVLANGECDELFTTNYVPERIAYYAESGRQYSWAGNLRLCSELNRFVNNDARNSCPRRSVWLPYTEIDINGEREYTVYIR
jgi:uncharacterized membrane protein